MIAIVAPIKAQFDRVYGLLEEAVENCPDACWIEKTGGFFFWQQIYHVFVTIDSVVLDFPESIPTLYPVDVGLLKQDVAEAPDKALILNMAKEKKALASTWIEALREEDLWQRHEIRSKRQGRDVSMLEALLLLVGHGFYHVGACDAALRDRGLKGMM